jgi:hypothetical protein
VEEERQVNVCQQSVMGCWAVATGHLPQALGYTNVLILISLLDLQ